MKEWGDCYTHHQPALDPTSLWLCKWQQMLSRYVANPHDEIAFAACHVRGSVNVENIRRYMQQSMYIAQGFTPAVQVGTWITPRHVSGFNPEEKWDRALRRDAGLN